MSRALYTLAWVLVTPLVMLYLLWRSRRQPEYRAHWAERWGFGGGRADDAPLLWVHAVSVGETRAVQPLVAALMALDPSARLLLTHMTPTGRDTGAQLYAQRYGERFAQVYLPYDYPCAVRRFLAAWRPTLGVLMETELWPNLCAAAVSAGVPLAAVNVRLSERSLGRGARWGRLIRDALASLVRVVAQTPDDARRLHALGRHEVLVAGNLKFDATPSADLIARGHRWHARLGEPAVVLAASTRDGEESLLLDAWLAARAERLAAARGPDGPDGHPRRLLVVVPRHPQRFEDVAAEMRRRGLALARRAQLDAEDAEPMRVEAGEIDPEAIDAVLGDSMGEMAAYYAAADVVIMGGTLLPFGGQNLIEACAVGVPVILGPHTYNFADAAEQAVAAGAALRVADAREAVHAARRLLADPVRRAEMGRRASAFATAHRGATQRTVDALSPWWPAGRAGPRTD